MPIELLVAQRGCLEASAGVLQEQWAYRGFGGDGTTMGTRGGVWGSKSPGGEYEGKRDARPLAPGD